MREIIDRLSAVRTYTAKDLSGHSFRDVRGTRHADEVILVSVQLRDKIIAALSDKPA
jgi:hypothetical protein